MEKPFTILKQYLKSLSDKELRVTYEKELDRENAWKEIDLDVFIWINKNHRWADWALLNEIAVRWAKAIDEGKL